MRVLSLALLLLTLPLSLSHAGGGSEVGNGGDIAILPDDSVILADPYIPRTRDSDIAELNSKLKTDIQRAGRLLVRLGAAVKEAKLDSWPIPRAPQKPRILSRSLPSQFIVDHVLNRKVEYHFVDILPESCRSAGDVTPVPGGPVIAAFGCTQGVVTWIQKDYFSRMNIREQTKAIIHERLHALPTSFPHSFIGDITDGLDILLFLFNEQALGRRPTLSPNQLDVISKLIKRIVQTGLSDGRLEPDFEFLDHWTIAPNGGGLIHREALVSPHAYIGVGSLIGAGSRFNANSLSLDSSCYLAQCHLEEGASLIQSTIEPGFGDDYSITPFTVQLSNLASLDATTVRGSLFSTGAPHLMKLGSVTQISQSYLSGISQFFIADHALIQNSVFNISDHPWTELHVSVGERSSLMNLFIPAVLIREIKTPPPILTLSFAPELVLKPELSRVCPSGAIMLIKGDIKVDSLDALKTQCQSLGASQ